MILTCLQGYHEPLGLKTPMSESANTVKEKYLELAKRAGVQSAVQALHHELWTLEQECFDTPEGYRPEIWAKLNELRLFSRELWDLNLG